MHADASKLQAHFEACAKRLLDAGEKLYPLGKACSFIERTRGEKVSTSALCRWILRGKEGVKLDAIRLNGGGWWTSREAIKRFAVQLSAAMAGKALAPEAPTETDLMRRSQAARARMRADGVNC